MYGNVQSYCGTGSEGGGHYGESRAGEDLDPLPWADWRGHASLCLAVYARRKVLVLVLSPLEAEPEMGILTQMIKGLRSRIWRGEADWRHCCTSVALDFWLHKELQSRRSTIGLCSLKRRALPLYLKYCQSVHAGCLRMGWNPRPLQVRLVRKILQRSAQLWTTGHQAHCSWGMGTFTGQKGHD